MSSGLPFPPAAQRARESAVDRCPPELWLLILQYAISIPLSQHLRPRPCEDAFLILPTISFASPNSASKNGIGYRDGNGDRGTDRSTNSDSDWDGARLRLGLAQAAPLLRVCRAWRRLAESLLYEHIALSDDHRSNGALAAALDRPLPVAGHTASSSHASTPKYGYVRHMRIVPSRSSWVPAEGGQVCDYLLDHFVAGSFQALESLHWHARAGFSPVLTLLTLVSPPTANLRVLVVGNGNTATGMFFRPFMNFLLACPVLEVLDAPKLWFLECDPPEDLGRWPAHRWADRPDRDTRLPVEPPTLPVEPPTLPLRAWSIASSRTTACLINALTGLQLPHLRSLRIYSTPRWHSSTSASSGASTNSPSSAETDYGLPALRGFLRAHGSALKALYVHSHDPLMHDGEIFSLLEHCTALEDLVLDLPRPGLCMDRLAYGPMQVPPCPTLRRLGLRMLHESTVEVVRGFAGLTIPVAFPYLQIVRCMDKPGPNMIHGYHSVTVLYEICRNQGIRVEDCEGKEAKIPTWHSRITVRDRMPWRRTRS